MTRFDDTIVESLTSAGQIKDLPAIPGNKFKNFLSLSVERINQPNSNFS